MKKKVLSLHWKKKDSAMETEKIKVPVKQALPMIAEMIKFKYVTDYIGKSSSWIYHKMNHETTTTTSKGFSKLDINLLNKVFQEIGEKLLSIRITPHDVGNIIETRKDIVSQIKNLSQIVSMPFIYIDKLGKNITWYKKRMYCPEKYQFKDEDITLINMAIVEIANKLLSIELIV